MKLLLLVPLLAAGAALAWIASAADEPTYEPPLPGVVANVVPTTLDGVVPAGMTVKRFHVTGMCCEGCTGKLYRALLDVDGVQQAAVDFHSSTASAVVPDAPNEPALLAALTFDKYAAVPAP